MIIWAMLLSTVSDRGALIHAVHIRMESTFLPPMRTLAQVSFSAGIGVLVNRRLWVPLFTDLNPIVMLLNLSAIVLPVMSIHTQVAFMRSLVVGAPNCFEMEHIEVIVEFHLLNQVYWYLVFTVCECAIIPVFTSNSFVRIACTEFCFVLFRMVKNFYAIVRKVASILIRTMLFLPDVFAKLSSVSSQFAASVFSGVVVMRASLLVVIAASTVSALLGLIDFQI